MSKGFWLLVIISVLLAAFAWKSMSAHKAPPLRSEHAEPAATMPPQPVAITAEGKQFHDPTCKYIHGKPQMMSAEQAAKAGYTPDPRCLRETMKQ